MARPPASGDNAGPPSSNKPFPQRFTVVEHLPSGSSQAVSQSSGGLANAAGQSGSSTSTSTGSIDAQRFALNSQAMEERAKNEFRDTLHWVSRLSGGPVDRRLLREAARSMKPNAYKDVMTERWVADMCAYPACSNGPRKPYNAEQPMYRINLRAKRVFDTSAAMKYCSDECARRSIWYETVCLQQNAFEVLDPSQPIQLLEDTENIMQTDSISLPAQLPPAQLEQLQQSSDSTMSSSSAPADLPVQVEEIAYNQQAESFLARLAIVERQPTHTPLPPSEDYADEINQEDNPTIAQVGIASSNLASSGPFNLDSLHRDLPSETQDSQTGSTVIVEERAGLARRIEIDVDPEYRNLLDEGFELYKQMKEAGEFT